MKSMRIGFIGCGGMARGAHLPAFSKCRGTKVTAITEPSADQVARTRDKCSELGIPMPVVYDDYRDMLNREKLDIVGIFTPHTQHFDQTVRALDAGCHVLIEKPMVTSVKEARALARKVEASGKVASIAYPGAFSVHHRAAQEFIASGRAGAIKTAELHVMQGGWKVGTTGSWRQDPRLSGGGQFYDTGSHLLNSMIWILDDSVVDVAGFYSREKTKVDINGTMAVRFKKGTIAAVMIGGHGAARCIEEIVFFGEKATLKTGIWGGRLQVLDSQGNEIKVKIGKPLSLQQTFINVIEGKCANPAPVKFGLYLSVLMEKVYANLKQVK